MGMEEKRQRIMRRNARLTPVQRWKEFAAKMLSGDENPDVAETVDKASARLGFAAGLLEGMSAALCIVETMDERPGKALVSEHVDDAMYLLEQAESFFSGG